MNYFFYCGIDMSKEWFDAAILCVNKPLSLQHKQFENTQRGFKTFLKWLQKNGVQIFSQVFICMEHTGVYTIPLCRFLNQKELAYTLVPGAEIKNSAGITRGKSDKLDAKRIARYVYKNRDEIRIHTLPSETIRVLKALLAQRDRIIKSRHSFKVSSQEMKAFEIKDVFDSISNSSKQIIAFLNEELTELEKAIDNCLEANEELKRTYNLLLSVPGIGRQNAIYMLVITQNFVSFNCPRKFAAYSGIAPYKDSSGKSKHSKSKVSPKANKKMKALLTSAVVCSLRKCAEYRLYFEKQLERGKSENSIKNVLRNKIVHRAFAVVKRNSPYVNTHAFAS